MYGVGGEHRLTEIELPWLPGYEESVPVRIGYGAYDQFQLDIYGETLNTLYEARVNSVVDDALVAWDQLIVLVDFVERSWQRPDEGIWEIRGKSHLHFVHSKLMAWVAVDRGVKFIERFGKTASRAIEQRLPRWRALREEIRGEYHPGLHRQLGNFPQAFSHVGIIDSAFRLQARRERQWQSFPAAMADAVA